MLFYLEEVIVMNINKNFGRSTLRFARFCLFLSGLFLATAVFVVLATHHTDSDAALSVKKELPLCTNDTSVYSVLSGMGEQSSGVGNEESKLALEQKGVGVVFTLNQKTGSWSFLTTNNRKRTCFVAMGKRWHKVGGEGLKEGMIRKGDGKQVGYSAPLPKMKEELLKEGKTEVGFGEQDVDLEGSPLLGITTRFFTDSFGSFTAVTSMLYKNKGSGAPFEISSIDAVGSGWAFNKKYENYTVE